MNKLNIMTFSKRTLYEMPRQHAKNANILYSDELAHHIPKIFNEETLSTLNNYAEKNNARILFSYMPGDMFHNTQMSVYNSNTAELNSQALKLKIKNNEDFVNSLRTIYTQVAESIKKLSQK